MIVEITVNSSQKYLEQIFTILRVPSFSVHRKRPTAVLLDSYGSPIVTFDIPADLREGGHQKIENRMSDSFDIERAIHANPC
jgi:hypothetical protein